MIPAIKRMEFDEHGNLLAIEFYEGDSADMALRVAIRLANPYRDESQTDEIIASILTSSTHVPA